MADDLLRRLERQASTGDIDAERQDLLARVRTGQPIIKTGYLVRQDDAFYVCLPEQDPQQVDLRALIQVVASYGSREVIDFTFSSELFSFLSGIAAPTMIHQCDSEGNLYPVFSTNMLVSSCLPMDDDQHFALVRRDSELRDISSYTVECVHEPIGAGHRTVEHNPRDGVVGIIVARKNDKLYAFASGPGYNKYDSEGKFKLVLNGQRLFTEDSRVYYGNLEHYWPESGRTPLDATEGPAGLLVPGNSRAALEIPYVKSQGNLATLHINGIKVLQEAPVENLQGLLCAHNRLQTLLAENGSTNADAAFALHQQSCTNVRETLQQRILSCQYL